MFSVDAHTGRAMAWLAAPDLDLSFSDWCLTEFSSALALGFRAGRLTSADREAAESALASWLGQDAQVEAILSDDIRAARSLIRRTQRPLRASDALHLAVVRRLGDSVATFDVGMARAAADLGIPVEDLSPHP
jgi:predicted nucleic acid-binding protein